MSKVTGNIHTIGLIFPELVDFGAMCWGAFDAAADHGATAICFQGNPLQSPVGFNAQANILYDLITSETPLDGFVIWTGWLGQFVGAAEAVRFCKHFAPLPVVSISQKIDGIPCVLGDNYKSMRDIITHLVDVHHCRRLAFVNGPPHHVESAERYRAYVDLLTQYGFAIDPALVVREQFTLESGIRAVHQLLDERRIDFDAVITGDDFVALGVIEGLRARGIRVPEDVAVVGFDDTPHARATIPPLTTIRQSAYDQGYQGVALLMAHLQRDDTPMQINLPMRLVVRQSCGCSNPLVLRAKASTDVAQAEPQFWAHWEQDRQQIIAAVTERVGEITDDIQSQQIETLCDTFALELAGIAPGHFLATLEEGISQTVDVPADISVYQDVISAMRQTILPLLSTRQHIVLATNLWGQARVLIGETALRMQAQRRLQADQQARLLREIGQELITTFDLDGLKKLLVQELPKLGIEGCWLVRYDPSKHMPPEQAYMVTGFENDQGMTLPPGGQAFAAHRLAADWLHWHQQPRNVIIEPLYFREQQLGFVIFEPGPRDGSMYEVLRGYLTTALYGTLLFQRNLELYRQAVQARAEAEKADQIKTLLLANVSHELRAPLNVILGYTQAALANPTQYGITLPSDLMEDLQHVRSSAAYLVRIINDLLDLSRAEINELDLHPEMIDPQCLLQAVFHNMQERMTSKDDIEWQWHVPAQLPLIQADPDRLRQIMFNLLSNARQYTPQGRIALGADIQPPYLHIWVQDTGIGIPANDQERIFEPFEIGENVRDRHPGIGLGLSITRRLVLLHKGTIALESAPGRGSTFHVYLPLPSLSGDFFVPDGVGHAALLLLSTQDTPPSVAVDLTERQQWILECVRSKAEFRALMRDNARQYVAIAWDLNAAQPGDWNLARYIQSHPQLCRLPLLLFGDPQSAAPAETTQTQTQVTQVMIKPISGDMLLEAIARLVPDNMSGVVLAIDDDPQALDLYQRLVQNALPQFAVEVAETGVTALRKLDEGLVPALIILDLMMPDLDGFEVLDQLRGVEVTRHVPVLVLSGKMLTADDIRRLSNHDVLLHSKHILTDDELERVLCTLVSDDPDLPRQTSELAKLALAYIHTHYTRPISRSDICHELGISENYLSRLFRQELGLTFIEYTNRYRIHIAKQLLRDTGASITAVAQQVGVDDPAYFSRVFKRYVDLSPRQYRRSASSPS